MGDVEYPRIYEGLITKGDYETAVRFLELIIKKNESINLTGIRTLDEGLVIHIEDSTKGLPEIKDSPAGSIADIGSGCGFPGVVVALATGRKTLLIDSSKKKMEAVNAVLKELGLGDSISTAAIRIEEAGNDIQGQYSVVTARALAPLPVLIELATPLLNSKGRLIAYKAIVSDEEMKDGDVVASITGMKRISTRNCMLSKDEMKRTIIVYEKCGVSQIELPRRVGRAQKRPLSS